MKHHYKYFSVSVEDLYKSTAKKHKNIKSEFINSTISSYYDEFIKFHNYSDYLINDVYYSIISMCGEFSKLNILVYSTERTAYSIDVNRDIWDIRENSLITTLLDDHDKSGSNYNLREDYSLFKRKLIINKLKENVQEDYR